jgi:hypothetical protein
MGNSYIYYRPPIKLENVNCILSEKLKDKKFKKLYDKEVKKLEIDEESLKQSITEYKENKMKKKLLAEGYKEMAEKEVTFDNVDDIIDELGRHTGWTIWDYIVSYWHRYFWNYVSEIPLRVKTFIQRGMRGWADSDTWCLDYYLATIISEGVKHLIAYGNSCWTKKDLASLKEIIKTFKTANEINGHNLIYTPSKKFTWTAYKKQKRTCKYMNKKYPDGDSGHAYRVMTLREVLRFEKGFDTFKEKFFYLWD